MRKTGVEKLLILIAGSIIALGNLATPAGQTPYLIKSHNLKIEFNPFIHEMKVVDKIFLSENWDSNQTFTAKIDPLFVVSDVYMFDEQKAKYTYQNGKLEVSNLSANCTFTIEYYGILDMDWRQDNFGKVADSYYLLKDLDWIFTPSDTKAEKATMEYHFPKELDIITEGRKISESVVGHKKISTWEVDGCRCSWLYFMVGDWHKTTKRSSQTEIRVWLTSEKPELAEQLVKRIESILELYSRLYTPYPLESFTYIEFPNDYPAWNGYLKLVFMREYATWGILDDIEFVAHEIAHNWWPNYIGLKGNEELDLDAEAFCDFSATLVNEFLFGSVKRQERAKDLVWFMAYPEDKYRKGRSLLHNLRLIYGDQLFFKWIKDFSERYKGRTTSIEDFFGMAPRKEGFDLNGFLANWKEIKIPPVFDLKYQKKKIKLADWHEITINIHQQSNPLAKWYLPVLIRSKDMEVQKVVELRGETTESRFETEFEPEEVLLDQNYIIPRRVPEFQKFADVLVLIDAKVFPLIWKNKEEECVPLLLKALELDKENAETHYLLGRVYKNLGQQDKAKQYFSEAANKNLGWYMGNRYTTEQLYVYSHWELAQIYLKEGNDALAQKNLEAILKKPDIEGYHGKASDELKKIKIF